MNKDAYDEVTSRVREAAWIIEAGDEVDYWEVMNKMTDAFSYIDGMGVNESYCYDDVEFYSLQS